MAISQIPALPWQIIFGRPSFGRSTPTSNGNFTDSCEIHISFLLWELHIWQTRSWQIYPPVQWWFHRFLLYWQSSYLADPLSNGDFTESCEIHIGIHTLRALHLADQVMADLSPIKWQFQGFLLWQLTFHDSLYFIPTLTAHHLAVPGLGRCSPHQSGKFTDSCSDNFYFIPTLRAHHLADQVLAYLPPHPMAISQIPALTAHYSESSTIGRPVLGRCNPPCQMAISQIPALLWKVIFGRLSFGRSTPCQMGILQISPLKTHISFLLWKLHIWQTRSWQIYPPHQWQFYRFLIYSESSYLADQVLADLTPTSNGNFTDSCSTLRDHIWQTKFWQIYPHIKWQFYRFLWNWYFIPTLRAQHLADQVCRQIWPPIKSDGNFIDDCEIHRISCLHSADHLTFGWPGLGRSPHPHEMAISQIPALTAPYSESSTFGRPGLIRSSHLIKGNFIRFLLRPGLGRSNSAPIKWQFHRFLWNSYFIPTLTAQHLAHQFLADVTSCHQMANSQIPALLWKLIYGRLSVGRSTPPSYGNFTDFCSDNSYFIPTLTVPHLADQVFVDLPPHQRQFHRFQLYSERSYLADQVLADVPPVKWQFCTDFCSDSSYFIPTLTAQHLADQFLTDVTSHIQMANLQILALTAQYSESLSYGWLSVGRSTPPHHTAISQISALLWEAHI